MPFVADYNGEHVTPEEVEQGDELVCLGCGDELTIRNSHQRNNGTFVARHFMHKTSGEGGSCCAESDKHKKMKSITLSKLKGLYETSNAAYEETIETRSGRRRTDVLIEFEQPKTNLGKGIAAEVQHRNESKDIDKVTSDICGVGYTVLWVSEGDIDGKDVDLSKCRVCNPFPHGVPPESEWRPSSPLSTKKPEEFGTIPSIKSDVRLRFNPVEDCIRFPLYLLADNREELIEEYVERYTDPKNSSLKHQSTTLRSARDLDLGEGYIEGRSLYLIWKTSLEQRPWGTKRAWESPTIAEWIERATDEKWSEVFSEPWSVDRVLLEVGRLYDGGVFDESVQAEFCTTARFEVLDWVDVRDLVPNKSVKYPCQENKHEIVNNSYGYRVCDKCGLALQSITDWVGHEVTEDEYRNYSRLPLVFRCNTLPILSFYGHLCFLWCVTSVVASAS